MKKIFLFVAMTFMLLQNSFAQQTHWSYDSHEFETNMTCNVVVSINDEEQFNPNLEIGAFCGEKCRGAIIAEEGFGSRYFFYLTVYGQNGDQIRFKIYDHAQEAELDLECGYVLTYESNAVFGFVWDPKVLKFYGTSVTTYTISASADPEYGGTVSGAGIYNEGETVTLTAEAVNGYTFINWTENENEVSSDATYTFTAESDRTLVANFDLLPPDTYEITATADPKYGGTVFGAGTYDEGETVTLTAEAADGYTFINWTENEVEVSSDATYTFTAESDRTLVANFGLLPPDTYVITATADPEYGGAVEGAGTYDEGEIVTMTASSFEHYHFVNWTEDELTVSEEAEFSFEAAADRTLVAHFELDKYNITATAEPAEGGEASVSNANPQHGELVTATAMEYEGYRFVNWTENELTVSEEAEFSFEAAADRDLVANFVEEGYGYTVTVAANPANGGVVGIDNENPQYGENVTATAEPKEGYRFVNWTEKGSEVSSVATYVFAATADRTLVANFQKESDPVTHWTPCDPSLYEGRMSVTAILQINGEEQFTDKYEIGAFCGDECRAAIRPVLIPETGQYVYYLYVYGENGNEITFRLYDHSIQQEIDLECQQTLTFDEESQAGLYPINFVGAGIVVAADPEEGGVVSGGGFYKTGAEVTVTASRNPKYDFINWTEDGEEVSTDAEFTFIATEGVRTLVAHFETQKTHWTCDPSLYEVYEGRMSVTAILKINDEEQFTDMYEIGAFWGDECRAASRPELIPETGQYVYMLYVLGDDGNEITFRLYDHEADKVVTEYGCLQTLTFEDLGSFGTLDDPYVLNFVNMTIAATAAPEEGGTVTGKGNYAYNATATLTATASEHYHFLNWTENGEVVEEAEEYTFTVTANRTLVANFEPKEYTITATAEPEEGGAVEGAGQHTALTEVTLTATPNAHYHFVNWTEGEEIVSSDTTYTFQALGDRTLVANFELNVYTIIAGVEPENSGKVNGEVTFTQTYTAFTDVTLTATPNEHYHFLNWTDENGEEVSMSAEYKFQALGNRTLVANFELNEYTIIAGVNPENSGKVNGEVTFTQTYTAFTDVTLTATPNEHYHFLNWTDENGEEVSMSAEYTFQALGDRTLVANFELNDYTITATAEPEEGGTVEGSGLYTAFDYVTLTATPNAHYHFVNWTEGDAIVSENTEYTFQALGDRDLVANFELNIYTVVATVNPADGGTVNGVVTYTQDYTALEEVTLIAVAAEHYHFVKWTVNGEEVSMSAEYTFTATGDMALIASFELNTYTISAAANPTEGGTVEGVGEYTALEEVTLTATPNAHYHFLNWTEGDAIVSENTEYTFQALGDRTLVANFELNTYEITATAEPEEDGTVEGAGQYIAFTEVTLTATPNAHYHFVNWTEDGTEVSTSAEYTFQALGDRTLVAHFELNEYTITATAEPEEGGTVEGAGQYIAFTEVTLTATPNEHYHFVNWTENGTVVSTDAAYSFIATSDRALIANFELNVYTITVAANPTLGGSAEVDNANPQYGTQVTATATPAANYSFVNWTENGNVVSTDATYTFTATGDRSLTANFEMLVFTITATANPAEGGTIAGTGNYAAGLNVTLYANANAGYTFVSWTENGNVVSTNVSLSFPATENRNLTANFTTSTYTITATAKPTEGGIATVDNANPQHGATVTATAIAGPGYHFVNWTENGTEVSADAVYAFTATADRYLTANFVFLSYEITVSSDPEEAGTVSGGGVYNYGDNVTISFTANPGYVFMGWYVDDELLSEESTYTFMAESDMDIVAKGTPDGIADDITVEASVYPNPTRDNIKIECDGMERVVITSIQGKVVYDCRVMNDNVIINMSAFAQGSYIMNIYAKDGNVTKVVTLNK